jgi:urease accessory protein
MSAAMPSIIDVMRLLQFGDSVLPVGSFAFSNGIEAAVQQRIVHDRNSLCEFVRTALHQSATSDGVALLEAHRAARANDIDRIARADRAVFQRKLNEEMRTMTLRMGRKLSELTARVVDVPIAAEWLRRIATRQTPGTFPVGLALAFSALGRPEQEAFAAHQYGAATMMLSAALRLMKVDHFDAQTILYEVNGAAADAYPAAAAASLDDMHAFAPIADILAAIHVKAHVRMFMN